MNNQKLGRARVWLGTGLLATLILAGCGGGGGGNDAPASVNAAPKVSLQFAGTVSTGASGADATATTGADVVLDASTSSDAEGDALTYAWSLVSKPTASAYVMGTANIAKLSMKPDVLGNYVFNLRVTDSKGAFADKGVTVTADNTPPNPVIVVKTSYSAQEVTMHPALSVSVGSGVVLDATGSTDADGDVVTTTWELIEKPASSTAALVVTGQSARFSPDVLGLYKIRARGADGKGASAETVYQISAANVAPVNVIHGAVAVITRDTQTVPVGQPVVTSGILSFDDAGAKLSYAWAVDTRPSGSVAALGAATAAVPSFTPDVAGAYVLSLTVNNGRQTAVAYLKLSAFISSSSVVALPFTPLEARYSKGLDRLVVIAANPNTLKVINPADGAITSIDLPNTVKSFNLSADGKLAAVLHEGVVSLVDLAAGALVRSSSTSGAQTEVFITNEGIVFLTGQTGSSWARPAVSVINARTGQVLPALDYAVAGSFYGTMRGVFAASKNKAFVMSNGLSPGDIAYFTVDQKTGAISGSGDSPYHGDYPMAAPFFLSATEDLLFTGGGTYFDTNTLKYVGRFILSGSNSLLSMSHSGAKSEALVMESAISYSYPSNELTYMNSYKRYSGELLFPAGDVSLPVIGGEASYGIGIFHTTAGEPVALVQTGGATKSTVRAKYYLVYR